jgi:hypothetical protein
MICSSLPGAIGNSLELTRSATMSLESLPITCSIPEFGAVVYDHKSDNPSYELAKRGDIPVIEYGSGAKVKRKRVPVRVALQQMAGNDPGTLEALARDFVAKLEVVRARAKSKRAAA